MDTFLTTVSGLVMSYKLYRELYYLIFHLGRKYQYIFILQYILRMIRNEGSHKCEIKPFLQYPKI